MKINEFLLATIWLPIMEDCDFVKIRLMTKPAIKLGESDMMFEVNLAYRPDETVSDLEKRAFDELKSQLKN